MVNRIVQRIAERLVPGTTDIQRHRQLQLQDTVAPATRTLRTAMRHHRVGKETDLLLVIARTRLTETRITRRSRWTIKEPRRRRGKSFSETTTQTRQFPAFRSQ